MDAGLRDMQPRSCYRVVGQYSEGGQMMDSSGRDVDQAESRLVELQILREQGLGYRTVERFRSDAAKRRHVRERGIQYLLEEAILSLLLDDVAESVARRSDVGELRAKFRRAKLGPVLEALERLTAARRGQPSTFKRFWDLLDLPQHSDAPEAFERLAELALYTTLHELLVSVVSVSSETSGARLEDGSHGSSDDEMNQGDDRTGVGGGPWPWIPERQLYQRVWHAFQINLVSDMSLGALDLPKWLGVSIRSSKGCDAAFAALEDRLDRAYSRPRKTRRVRSNAKSATHAREQAARGTSIKTPPEAALSKPYSEMAEEFAAVLVQLTAELTAEDAFVWFQRRQPPGDARGLASWIPTPALMLKLEHVPNVRTTFTVPVNAPLLVPPRKWTVASLSAGGYYRRRLPFYKFHEKNDRIRDFLRVCAHPELQPALEAVNAIQETAYRVNLGVWDLATKLAVRVEQLQSPARLTATSTPIDAWLRTYFAPRSLSGSEDSDTGPGDRLRSPIVRGQVDELVTPGEDGTPPTFYFAHQADTRGRLYAVTQWLSPQGEDLSRALLEFAAGKPATDAGRKCLAVYGTQLLRSEQILMDLGVTARRPPTNEERLSWIDARSEAIVASALDPLAHLHWTTAKSPFQYLAFCLAWKDLLAQGPSAILHLPVHVDGVCNGLQHIAALTGDAQLAVATNLRAGPPQDIYALVMRAAINELSQQRSASPYAALALDCSLVDRDLAKSVVMIIPYGAGERGYVRAVRSRLRTAFFLSSRSFKSPTALGQAFLTKLSQAFPGDLERLADEGGNRRQPIGEHLTNLAEAVARSFADALAVAFPSIERFKKRILGAASEVWTSNIPLVWQSPSGLCVLQRGFLEAKAIVDCRLASSTFGNINLADGRHAAKLARIKFTGTRLSNDVNKREQASGLLPNFIHSLDSAHLTRTIQLAVNRGVRDLAVVHDSFGTHAADMPLLATCLREAFAEIYSRETPPLVRFEQWCLALSIAARAPSIESSEFLPHIALTAAEIDLYDMVARWAGRDSQLARSIAADALRIVERLQPMGSAEVESAAVKRILLFSADRIELEWPVCARREDMRSVLESDYFFS